MPTEPQQSRMRCQLYVAASSNEKWEEGYNDAIASRPDNAAFYKIQDLHEAYARGYAFGTARQKGPVIAEATKHATDSGAAVQTAKRALACTYLGAMHPIAKGEQYVAWLPGWGHVKTDRVCIPCGRRLGLVRPEEEN